MADKDVNIKMNVEPELKGVNQMKKEMKELKVLMDQAAEAGDSIAFEKASKSLGELKNDMADAAKRMKMLDPGELLNGWIKFAQGVTGGFAVATGAAEMFGGSQEEIQEIQKKSMLLIQTMMGLEQLRATLIDKAGRAELKDTIQNTAAQAKELVGRTAMVFMTKEQIAATEGATVAQKAMNIAAMANPYVLLAMAIAALVVGVAAYASNAREMAKADQKLIDKQDELRKNTKLNQNVVEASIAMSKAQLVVDEALADVWEKARVALGGLTDAQIEHLNSTKKMGQTAQTIGEKEIALAEARGASEEELLKLKKEVWLKEAIVRKKLLETNTELSNDEKKAEIERIKELSEEYQKAGFDEILLNEKNKKKKADDDKKAADDAKKEGEKNYKERLDANKNFLRKIDDQIVAAEQDETTRSWMKVELDNQRAIEDINNSKASNEVKKAALLQQEINYQQSLKDIEKKAADDKKIADDALIAQNLEKNNNDLLVKSELNAAINNNDIQSQMELLQTKKDIELTDAQLTADEKLLIEQTYQNAIAALIDEEVAKKKEAKEAAIQLAQEEFDQKLNTAQNLTTAIGNIAMLAAGKSAAKQKQVQKTMFKVDKAFGVARATIDGLRSIQAALTMPPPGSYVMAAINGVMAAGTIAKILSTKFNDGGGEGGAPSVAAPSAPSMSSMSTTTPTSNFSAGQFYGLGQGQSNQNQQTQKVVVVETDITRTQRNVSKIETRATQTL